VKTFLLLVIIGLLVFFMRHDLSTTLDAAFPPSPRMQGVEAYRTSERARLDSFRLVRRWSCYYWSPEHNLKVVGPDEAAALTRDSWECAPAKT
jgi:hypothetical protein